MLCVLRWGIIASNQLILSVDEGEREYEIGRKKYSNVSVYLSI